MKHLKIIPLTTLLGLALSLTGFSQSCLPEGIIFSTQSQIDSFQINYPNCTEIEGDVIICGSDISNLTGLSVISLIEGDLRLYSNPILSSLNGLNGLTAVDGCVNIGYSNYYGQYGNPSLINLSGLNNLSIIGDSLVIIENPSLTSIGALANLSSAGSVAIKNNISLISLTGLEGLTSIVGGLTIFYNPALTTLSGLINLSSIYGDLYLYSNGTLTSLTGLDNLTYIGGSLTIKGHSSLTSLMGLEGLSFIGDDLNINTQALTNLIGLDNLAYIANDLLIDGNWILDNLTGLEGLDSTGGNLNIENNNKLISLTGLENLTSIEGYIWISNNYTLSDLTGLENIDASSIIYLNIYANDALSNCDVQSFCDFLAIPNSYSQFYANAAGCNSTAEVEAACLLGIKDKTTSANRINIFPNPSSDKITLEIKEHQHQSQLSICNLNGQELIKHKITEHATEIDISYLPEGIYLLRLTNKSEVKMFKVIKY